MREEKKPNKRTVEIVGIGGAMSVARTAELTERLEALLVRHAGVTQHRILVAALTYALRAFVDDEAAATSMIEEVRSESARRRSARKKALQALRDAAE